MIKKNSTVMMALFFVCMASCGEAGREAGDNSTLQDSVSETQKNNSGMPLNDLHRDNSSDTLKQEVESNTGVPLNNLRREQVPDSTLNSDNKID